MSGRDRFLRVINGEIPDRVPVTLFIVDQGHFINQLYPYLDPYDHLTTQLKIIEAQKQLGCDVYVRLLYGINPLWMIYGGVNTESETDNWEVNSETFRRGDTEVKKYTICTPGGCLYQEFSKSFFKNGTYNYGCTSHPVKTEKDLDLIIKFEPGMDSKYPENIKRRVSIIKENLKEDGIVGVWAPHSVFNNAASLIKLEELYCLFLTNFSFYDKLMNFSIERFKPYLEAINKSEVDVQSIGANIAGGFLGKKIFDKYILPYEKKYINIAQSVNIPVLYHNCGEIMNLIESYVEIGPKMVESFSPYPLGDGNLAEAKRRSNGAFIIVGNIDQVNILKDGTPELIKRITSETVEIGKENGKFILQPSDFIEYETPLKNLEIYIKTGTEFGVY